MCLAAFHINPEGSFPFVCLANRDEFHQRAAAPLHRWSDHDIVAGKDLQSGGTWLGINPRGQFGLLTNVRNAALNKGTDAPSRGHLITQYLTGGALPDELQSQQYAGFNLIAGELKSDMVVMTYLSNQAGQGPQTLTPGIHVLSNGALNDMWPKSEKLAKGLKDLMHSSQLSVDEITRSGLDLLADESTAEDAVLPSTGVPYAWEKMLSATKIVSPVYGTRCSTVLVMTSEGVCKLTEVSFGPNGEALGPAVQLDITLRSPCTDAR